MTRLSKEQSDAYRIRFLAAVRKDPDMTREQMLARFSQVSEDRLRGWLRAAGVNPPKPFDGLSDLTKRRRPLGCLIKKHRKQVAP